MDGETWQNILLVLAFILVGGVFAATEIALVSLRESQLDRLEKLSSRGAKVAALGRDPNRFLSAVQIGVTLAGFFSAAYGAATIAPDVAPVLQNWGLSEGAANTSAFLIMTLLIAYASLVLGELVPKRLALQKAESFSLLVAPVLDKFATLMRPIIWLLSKSTNGVVRLLGGDPTQRSEAMTDEELREIVVAHNSLDPQARQIVTDVFSAEERILRESMRPRHTVAFLRGELTVPEGIEEGLAGGHTRYPVAGSSIDEVLGFVHLRDLLQAARQPGGRNKLVRDAMRPILAMPDTKNLLSAIAQMREQAAQIALVLDEYGGTVGIVTLEDLIEDIIGQIRDEYDEVERHITEVSPPGHLLVDGAVVLEDFRDHTGIYLPDGDYETVAGFILAELDRVPKAGDRVVLEVGTLQVKQMVGYRIAQVLFIPPAESD